MLASASASGIHHAPSAEHDICYDYPQDWLLDRELLTDWQVQLVDCCHAINEQLTQIRKGLEDITVADDQRPQPIALRIARD